jgi:hypothetical protein
MKFSLPIFFLVLFFGACVKEQKENKPEKCFETVPKDEACMAYFNRWFYNPQTNQCQEIGYSGCSSKGFSSQKECEQCKCNNPIKKQ